jgi:hypothetical protein
VKQVSPSAAIEWRAISATLKRKGVSLSPTCCHVLWKYLAYGVVIARSSESEGVVIARSSDSEGVGIARSSDSEDMNQSSVVSSIPCDHDEVDIESDEVCVVCGIWCVVCGVWCVVCSVHGKEV